MKEGWSYVAFEKCLEKVPRQQQVKSKDYKEKGIYPIVSQESELISGYWDDEDYLYKHEKPVVIFGDHTKNIKYIDFDFVVGADGTHILLPIETLDAKFFYYALRSIKLRDLGYARHFKLLKQTYIPLPPLAEQERIVAYLDTQFAKIDAMKANAAKALAEAKALFQAALTEAMTPKEGWEMMKLGEIATSIEDGDWIESKDQSSYGIRLVQTGNIGEGIFKNKAEKARYISEETFKRLHCNEIVEGDILVSRLPEPVGRACLLPNFGIRCITAVDCSIIRLKSLIMPELFVYYSISKQYYSKIASKCTGATRQRISRKNLAKIEIPIPPIPEQERIVTRLDALSAKVAALEANYTQMVAECDALKQALLREVFE